jgi:hypothetical protein
MLACSRGDTRPVAVHVRAAVTPQPGSNLISGLFLAAYLDTHATSTAQAADRVADTVEDTCVRHTGHDAARG